MKEFQNYLKVVSSELYSFSYALIPDDLQAQQLVLDSTALLISEKAKEIKILLENSNDYTKRETLKFFKITLYQYVFRIAKKRIIHIKNSLTAPKDFSTFYSLDIDDKSVLFLKHKVELDFYDIEEITQISKALIISKLSVARNTLANNFGESFPC